MKGPRLMWIRRSLVATCALCFILIQLAANQPQEANPTPSSHTPTASAAPEIEPEENPLLETEGESLLEVNVEHADEADATPALYPVRWRSARYGFDHIATTSDIQTQLEAPVYQSENFVLTMDMAPRVDGELQLDQQFEVISCQGETDALERGCYLIPNGWYSDDTSMRFHLRRTALTTLRNLQPSRESYVQDFVLARDALAELPKYWFTNRMEEVEAIDRLNSGIEVVPADEFDWGFLLKYQGPWDITMHIIADPSLEDFNEAETDLWYDTRVLAWGDANGDGVEDLVVDFWHGWMGAHAYGWGFVTVLTRFSEDERLVELDINP